MYNICIHVHIDDIYKTYFMVSKLHITKQPAAGESFENSSFENVRISSYSGKSPLQKNPENPKMRGFL